MAPKVYVDAQYIADLESINRVLLDACEVAFELLKTIYAFDPTISENLDAAIDAIAATVAAKGGDE